MAALSALFEARASMRSDGKSLTLQGIGASPGVAFGPAFLVERGRVRTPRYHLPPEKIDGEVARLHAAVELSDRQLEEVKARVARELDAAPRPIGGTREHALILDAYQSMLRDPFFLRELATVIRDERLNAEWAIRRVLRQIKGSLGGGDAYFRERRGDLDFLGDRLVKNLLGQAIEPYAVPPAGSVLVARDLSPADAMVLLVRGKIAGLVLDQGGRTGHTALLARAREIPAVVATGLSTARLAAGDVVALDGVRGTVILRPSPAELTGIEEGRTRFLTHERELLAGRDLPATTLDGVRVELHGNMEIPEEAPSLWAHGAEGIGLYRTEFLYLDRREAPTEEEHFSAYRALLQTAGSRQVTIRTFDLGADKVPGGARRHEANPAMGLRAIRFTLRSPRLFGAQLRGLLRASPYGRLRIMLPMLGGLDELREARAHLALAREELAREGTEIAERIPLGIMVELPAAAAIADRLARECDFFSIGTNDLVQYTLAADRGNPLVSYLYRPLHLGILRMLDFTVRAAHDAGIPVAMCGEMAGDPFYAAILVGLGFDELSMSLGSLLPVKKIIRALDAAESRQMVAEVMKLSTAEEIERFIRDRMRDRFGPLVEER